MSEMLDKFEKINKTYNRLPTQIATIAVNFSKERFVRQNWFDTVEEPWKPRRQRRKGGRKRSQTLLVDSGRLKRSIRKIYAGKDTIIIGTDVPYAEIHNSGGLIRGNAFIRTHTRRAHLRKRAGRKEHVHAHAVQAHSRKVNMRMPKRQFIGDSAELRKRITEFITRSFNDAIQ